MGYNKINTMLSNLFTYIAKAISIPLVFVLSAAGYSLSPAQTQQPARLGAAPQFTAAAPTTLYGSGITSSATSIRVSALTTPNGYPIQTADLVGGVGNVFYGTIEPSSARKETVSCTSVAQNGDGSATVSGCSRGLLFTYPYTASTTLARAHSGGSAFVLSNSPQLYNDIITYVNNAMAAGTVDASPTVKGVVEVSTAAEAASHAQNGSGNTSAYLALTTNVSSSTRAANTAQVVVSSSTDGYIDSSYLNGVATLSANNVWTGRNTFSTTTATTTNIGSFPAYQIGKNIQVFTSSGSFTPPSGVSVVKAEVVGAGGAGAAGSANTIGGGGGGGGAYCLKYANLSATTSVGVVVGTGGSSTGGTSSFGPSFCSAAGGNIGGTDGSAGSGGMSTSGDVNVTGQGGCSGAVGVGAGSSGGGCGGNTVLGGGAQGVKNSAGGINGGNYGGGGSGAGNGQTAGNGASGIVIISW